VTETDPNNPETQQAQTQANNVVPLPAPVKEQRPSEKVISFVKRHPVVTVAGAVAAGVAVSALLPGKPGHKTGRKLLGKALSAAESAGAATLMFGRDAGEKMQTLGAGTRKQATALAEKAEHAGHDTASRLEKYGLAALAAAGAFRRAAAKRAGELGDAASETATHIGDAASEQTHKVKTMAGDLKKRIGR
jgi:hypothetical protein